MTLEKAAIGTDGVEQKEPRQWPTFKASVGKMLAGSQSPGLKVAGVRNEG